MTDYDRIADAIDFIVRKVDSQPTLNEIAAHIHLSPFPLPTAIQPLGWCNSQKILASAYVGACQAIAE